MFQNKNLLFVIFFFIENGNSDESFKKYPYVVGIGFIETEQKTQKEKEINSCSGSLIEETWVITAGSCIHMYNNREHFVSFDEYNDGDVSVRKVKVLNRQLFTYAESDEDPFGAVIAPTLLGMVKIGTVPIKTLPKLSSDNYIQRIGLPVVYARYLAVFPEELKTSRLQIIEFIITPCPTVFKTFICVLDQLHVLSTTTYYGAPLIHDDTVIGLYAGSDGSHKMFVPVSEFLDKIRGKIAEGNNPLINTKLTMSLYYNNSHSKL